MFRWVSVKKLFFVLLAAIIALLLMFFIHGPYIEEGAEKAVEQALLERTENGDEETVSAEGHRLFQVVQTGEKLEVWGLFSTGTLKRSEDGTQTSYTEKAVPAKLTFEKDGSGWKLAEYTVPEDSGFSSAEMKAAFPFHLRIALLLSGLFESDLEEQMQAYAPA
ncbi:MAG: hypothetical protein IJJ25_14420 [Lachnospiraceae bacterium]|nr:hypothetical protein [Lachnospiraceae bacterium]